MGTERKAHAAELRRHAEDMLGVPARLHDYQWEGVSFLYRNRAALLADEMGLGKTVQTAVALALTLSTRREMSRALIVAPASLKMNWMSELAKWAPSLTVRSLVGGAREREAFYLLPIPVLVSSYEQIRQDGLNRIPSNTFDIVILDEAQRIKNPNSATALSCRLLSRKCSWALSATPLENDARDVASILAFLDPMQPFDMSARQLSARLSSMMLRRRKSEVRGELPPVIVQDLSLELAGPQRTRYDELWTKRYEAVSEGIGDTAIALLATITRLKIICNFDSDSGASTKFAALGEICAGAGPDARILVFSQFVETLKWVANRLGVACDLLTGSMSSGAREAAIERFKTAGTPRVLFTSLRAGGVGLNLGEATHVVMYDRWWNPAVEMQAVYRAHRFTRETPLHVVRFTLTGTIEERIASILDAKQRLFEDVVESTETTAQDFSVEELMHILEISIGDQHSLTKGTEDGRNHGENLGIS
ncbi:DEAD/DEAH box helicase [Candidatus Palauibacter sp.]|uniref:DEAD/DEAH box helicase n=1 Tax=Candidatus Palauibacter sp. TaxID=3101350 RepID=UPI003B59EF6B